MNLSEFSECARTMERMFKKYVKRFLKEEPTDKYYDDKDFIVGGAKAMMKGMGDKRYRPKRAASSRAMETVHKAMQSDEEEVGRDKSLHICLVRFDYTAIVQSCNS